MGPELCKTLEIRVECMEECVCMCLCICVLKGQNVLIILSLFFSLLGVRIKIGVKIDISCKFTLCQFYLCFLQ